MSVASPSVAIVIAYIGRAPMWLPAFLVSCRANPDVTWILYTDIDMGPVVPPNVLVKPTSMERLNARFSETLGLPIVAWPRKLNDLKPAFGVTFADDLRGFDFWAYADLDIVWGNIRHFLTDDVLGSYDLISSRPGKLSGHFTLFRNTEAMNRLFEVVPDMKELLVEQRHTHFDERVLTHCLKEALERSAFDPIPRIYWDRELSTNAAYQRSLSDAPSDALWWRDGRTIAPDGRELMYIHFHKLKQHMTTMNFAASDAPRAFEISRRGFIA